MKRAKRALPLTQEHDYPGEFQYVDRLNKRFAVKYERFD